MGFWVFLDCGIEVNTGQVMVQFVQPLALARLVSVTVSKNDILDLLPLHIVQATPPWNVSLGFSFSQQAYKGPVPIPPTLWHLQPFQALSDISFSGFLSFTAFSLYLGIIYYLKIFWKKLITFSVRWGQLKGEVTLFGWFKPCYIIVVLLYNLHYPSIDLSTVCALNKYLFDSEKMPWPIASFSSL